MPSLHSTLITNYSLKSVIINVFTTCWCACKWKVFVSDESELTYLIKQALKTQ